MKVLYRIFVIIPLLFAACKKEKIEIPIQHDEQPKSNLLANYFGNLRIEPLQPIIIDGGNASLKELIDSKKLNQLVYLRDSTWAGATGRTSFYESDEMVVTPTNRSNVYPGSVLKASSIATDEFASLFGYERAPISVQLSFPSSLSYGTISIPNLSNSRIFLRNAIMAPDFSGSSIQDFSQSISYFSKYQEVKLSFGYNVNEKRLFASTNSSFDYNSSATYYARKMTVSYTVKNFTYTMSDPVQGELIDMASIPPEVFNGVSPVYINSVTYGRFGLLVIETNNTGAEVQSAFEKVVKKIFKQTTESFTQQESAVFNSCRVTIYVLGSTLGESATQLLINPNPESISSFLSENVGTFTAQDPGVPIFFTAKYLKDNSQFKTVFKLDLPN